MPSSPLATPTLAGSTAPCPNGRLLTSQRLVSNVVKSSRKPLFFAAAPSETVVPKGECCNDRESETP